MAGTEGPSIVYRDSTDAHAAIRDSSGVGKSLDVIGQNQKARKHRKPWTAFAMNADFSETRPQPTGVE
jgi:hypothetical protein